MPMCGRLPAVAPLFIDLSPESRWPCLYEGLCRWVPPSGVLHKRDRHGVLNFGRSFAERVIDQRQKPVQGVHLPSIERLNREASYIRGEQVKKQAVVVRQMLDHQGPGLRYVSRESVEEVRRCHSHRGIMPDPAH